MPVVPNANSTMLVRPTNTAPAARRRATAGASVAAGSCPRIFEPARVTSPATSNRSFRDTGSPSTGERRTPALRSRSEKSASASALSAYTLMKARAPSPAGSAMRASACSVRRRLVVRPAARSAASCATVHMTRIVCAKCSGNFFGPACSAAAASCAAARRRELLCAACDADLPRLAAPRCPRCALESPRGEVCGRCLSEAPHYDATVAALAYEFPADALVHALKFRGELALAGFLGGALLGAMTSEPASTASFPVPLSAERLRERGYNQAAEIARHLSHRRSSSSRSASAAAIRRRRWTCRYAERRRNVRGAFRCTRALAGASVARGRRRDDDRRDPGRDRSVLKTAGAARVVNWVVARTFPARD